MVTSLPHLHSFRALGARHWVRVLSLALAVLPSCAVYDPSLLDTRARVTDPDGGADTAVPGAGAPGDQVKAGEGGSGGAANTGGDMSTLGGSGSSVSGGANNGGSSAGAASAGAASGGPSGGSAGSAGPGATGNAGTGGTAAGGTGAGGAAAGAPSGGSAGAGGAPINPCDRLNWKATASVSSMSPKTSPALAIDGTTSTRWTNGAVQVGGEWFLLDLGAVPAHLTQISLEASAYPGDEPLKYKLETSTDGKTFFLLTSGTGAATTVIKFADTAARYLRITQTGSAPDANWWSIQELTLTCAPK